MATYITRFLWILLCCYIYVISSIKNEGIQSFSPLEFAFWANGYRTMFLLVVMRSLSVIWQRCLAAKWVFLDTSSKNNDWSNSLWRVSYVVCVFQLPSWFSGIQLPGNCLQPVNKSFERATLVNFTLRIRKEGGKKLNREHESWEQGEGRKHPLHHPWEPGNQRGHTQ